jgi:hypothetical protein
MADNYIGKPLFHVGADDFIYISNCLLLQKRLLSKNIHLQELKDYYVKERIPQFVIEYNGLVLSWG